MPIPQNLRQKIFDMVSQKVEVVNDNVLDEGVGFRQRMGLDSVVDNICIKIDDILKDMSKCDDVFTKVEQKHLEEVLHGDLDGYFEEIKDMSTNNEFEDWKEKTVMILKKCGLNDWKVPEPYDHEEHKRWWKEGKI